MFSKKIIVFYQYEACCDYGKYLERHVECCIERTCLERLENRDIDLIILDCAVEADSSIDLLKNIKQVHPGIPVIVVTSFASEDFVIKAFKSGARDIFKKPVNGKELRKTVDSILWLRQESQERRKTPSLINPYDARDPLFLPDNIPEKLVRAIVYIEKNLRSALLLDEIASAACMSRFHFCRTFKKHVGISPLRYATNMRLKKAMILLQRKDLNISSVAVESGFNDLGEFNKQFKRHYGASPSAFRDSIRAKM